MLISEIKLNLSCLTCSPTSFHHLRKQQLYQLPKCEELGKIISLLKSMNHCLFLLNQELAVHIFSLCLFWCLNWQHFPLMLEKKEGKRRTWDYFSAYKTAMLVTVLAKVVQHAVKLVKSLNFLVTSLPHL